MKSKGLQSLDQAVAKNINTEKRP